MAIISISEAARIAQIARSTVQRAIKDGRLSATARPDGAKGVETAELARVFGESATGAQQPEGSRVSQLEAAALETENLRRELELLRLQLSAAEQRERWYQGRIERIDALERRLLPAPPAPGLLARLKAMVRRD